MILIDSRIVTLSITAHRGANIDYENLRLEKPYDARKEYDRSKLADILFALELGKRFKADSDDIVSVACHPEFTRNELQRHIDPTILEKVVIYFHLSNYLAE